MAPLSNKRLKLANRIITVTCSGAEATMLNDGWPSSYVCSDLLHTPRDMWHVSRDGAVVRALASRQCGPGWIPVLGHWALRFSPLFKNHHLQILILSWWCPEFVLCAKYLWHLNKEIYFMWLDCTARLRVGFFLTSFILTNTHEHLTYLWCKRLPDLSKRRSFFRVFSQTTVKNVAKVWRAKATMYILGLFWCFLKHTQRRISNTKKERPKKKTAFTGFKYNILVLLQSHIRVVMMCAI